MKKEELLHKAQDLDETSFNDILRIAQGLEKHLEKAKTKEEKIGIQSVLSNLERSLRVRQFMDRKNPYQVFHLSVKGNASCYVWRINPKKMKMYKTVIPTVEYQGNTDIIVGTYFTDVVVINNSKFYIPVRNALVYIGSTEDKNINKTINGYLNFKYKTQEELAKIVAHNISNNVPALSFSDAFNVALQMAWKITLVKAQETVRSRTTNEVKRIIKIFSIVGNSLGHDKWFAVSVANGMHDALNILKGKQYTKEQMDKAYKSFSYNIASYVASLHPELER